MGGAKTYTPYPTFYLTSPSHKSNNDDDYDATKEANLSAVGRCRIYPNSCGDNTTKEEYNAIVQKAVEQAHANGGDEDSKKLRKKYMKQGNAMGRSFLSSTLCLDASVIDVEMVVEAADVVRSDGCLVASLLDAGCDKVILTDDCATHEGEPNPNSSNNREERREHVLNALRMSRVPRDRLALRVREGAAVRKGQPLSPYLTEATSYVSTLTVCCSRENAEQTCVDWTDLLSSIPSTKGEEGEEGGQHADPSRFESIVFEVPASPTTTTTTHNNNNDDQTTITHLSNLVQTIAKLSDSTASILPHGINLTLRDTTPTILGSTYASALSTDRPDQLYTTVVVTRANEALGLVYSSTSSIVAALQCGRGVYYSRSRNGLWRKGDTSGMYQILHRIDVDCDGDALRFMVTQRTSGTRPDETPAFCHLNTLTCWGQPHGVRHLQQTLTKRLVDAPPGSYTARLFSDEVLLRDKLVEEAQELSEAENPKHTGEELADVLYFAMVKAAQMGVGLDEAVEELDLRRRKVTRRKGDSKVFRIQKGEEILGKKG